MQFKKYRGGLKKECLESKGRRIWHFLSIIQTRKYFELMLWLRRGTNIGLVYCLWGDGRVIQNGKKKAEQIDSGLWNQQRREYFIKKWIRLKITRC